MVRMSRLLASVLVQLWGRCPVRKNFISRLWGLLTQRAHSVLVCDNVH